MLQQETPDDYVLATGEMHSVKEFVQVTTTHLLTTLRLIKHVYMQFMNVHVGICICTLCCKTQVNTKHACYLLWYRTQGDNLAAARFAWLVRKTQLIEGHT